MGKQTHTDILFFKLFAHKNTPLARIIQVLYHGKGVQSIGKLQLFEKCAPSKRKLAEGTPCPMGDRCGMIRKTGVWKRED